MADSTKKTLAENEEGITPTITYIMNLLESIEALLQAILAK